MSSLSASQRIATFAVLAAMAVAVLDAGIVNVALPDLSARFHTSPSDTTLVVSAYQAALLVGLFPAAHIAGKCAITKGSALSSAMMRTSVGPAKRSMPTSPNN